MTKKLVTVLCEAAKGKVVEFTSQGIANILKRTCEIGSV